MRYHRLNHGKSAEWDSPDGRDEDELIPDSILEDDDTDREEQEEDKEEE